MGNQTNDDASPGLLDDTQATTAQHSGRPVSLPFQPMLRVAAVRARPGSRAPALTFLFLSAAATAAIVIAGKRIPPWSFVLMFVVAVGAFAMLLRRETKHPSLACWMV